jgi:hypothetical protein
MIGRPPSELLGQPIWDVIPETDGSRFGLGPDLGQERRPDRGSAPQKPPVPFGVPSPVGPSKPARAVQR